MMNIPTVFWLVPLASAVALGMAWSFFSSMMNEEEGTLKMSEKVQWPIFGNNIRLSVSSS